MTEATSQAVEHKLAPTDVPNAATVAGELGVAGALGPSPISKELTMLYKAADYQNDGKTEAERNFEVGVRLAELKQLEGLKAKGERPELQTWAALLGGEINAVSEGKVHVNEKAALMRAGGAQAKKAYQNFHTQVETGVDYKELDWKKPAGRFKFYHSFGNANAGSAYLEDVIKAAQKAGISMTMKSHEHAYDSMNIYTHHPVQMQAIIAEAYAAHPDAWLDTEHFLQGPLDGINPKHIGWVQEPVARAGQRSHSGRVMQIGQALDQGGLTEEAYRAGCEAAGVRPDAPWILTPAQEEYIARETLHEYVDKIA